MLNNILQWRFCLIQLCLLLLLSPAMTAWSMALFGGILAAKCLQLNRASPAWRPAWINLVALTFLALLLLFGRSLGVVNLMFHLLLLAAMLRLLSLPNNNSADWVQLLWVHYFLLACAFILHQEIWLALGILATGALNLSCHHLWFAGSLRPLNWQRLWRLGALTFTVTTLLFLFFPRLPPLWQLPSNNLAKSGLTDEVAPGDIASLMLSDELAFRVAFDGQKPADTDLYFRAKIYDRFDGSRWQVERTQGYNTTVNQSQVSASLASRSWRYTVVMEPHQQRHLVALGVPQQFSDKAELTRNWLLQSPQLVSQRLSYQVSALNSPVPMTAADDLRAGRNLQQRYLQLPAGNPQSRALAQTLRAAAEQGASQPNATALVAQISQFLQQGEFRYSLEPGRIDGAQIDTFLFSRKIGFCAHYAQAAVFLLRAAEVPARMVGGYLGGSWQDDGAYLQVRQADAHAWVEYNDGEKWQRFDPTALIEPAVFARNMAATSSSVAGNNVFWQQLQVMILLPLQHLDYYWSAWVLSFDQSRQRDVWRWLKNWPQLAAQWWQQAGLAASMVLIGLLLVALFALFVWHHTKRRRVLAVHPLLPLYHYYPKPQQQTVNQYLQQLQHRYPAQQSGIAELLALYQRWQFNDEKQLTASLARSVKQLSRKLKQGS